MSVVHRVPTGWDLLLLNSILQIVILFPACIYCSKKAKKDKTEAPRRGMAALEPLVGPGAGACTAASGAEAEAKATDTEAAATRMAQEIFLVSILALAKARKKNPILDSNSPKLSQLVISDSLDPSRALSQPFIGHLYMTREPFTCMALHFLSSV
ncbi:hypothetical protein L6164_019259 [Bauhinia variegata]|uniref:Uncharacterized protein n=1 Tax=Bauhinia variegata TaxID=167791 RepID=A0ACB9NDM7_BAUVA|nr:hypothetical protein L6164_019259 [Bauhinia variegata]